MRKILTADLKEGQTFSVPLFIDDDNIFVPKETPILKKDLDLLKTLDIVELFMEGVSPEINKVAVKKIPISSFSQRKFVNAGVSEAVDKLIIFVNSIFAAVKSKKSVNIRLLWHITDSLMGIVKAYRDDALKLILWKDVKAGFEMAKNSVDTAILSAVIGEEFAFSETKIKELIVAALLHDVGMLRLPEALIKKVGELSNRELIIIQSHTLHSFNIMKKEFMYPENVCQIALQHHEHWDGNGYPSRISGDKIDTSALIVTVVDSFIAMMSRKAYRNTMTGYQAMKTLLSENAVYFSPEILKMFVKIMGIYPIGSGVLLNDNSIAMVVGTNAKFPLRPVVQLLFDKSGDVTANDKSINLSTDKKLFITCAVDIKSFMA
ncbi:MAG: HD-GYP domain-containing protein [Spirochaetaceae bacterium]|jgi:HD-GYP domain-containing protein (c-di-GMP phosphodiesterase class II)|nr:HD-GYP domain-containing protein [Spirochaetaceae bacterium]